MQIKRTTEGSETWDASGNVTSAEIKFFVLDPTTKKAAMQACFDAAPGHVDPNDENSLPKSGVRFDSISGDGCYEISVLYEEDSDSASGDYSSGSSDYIAAFSFDCGGGQRHVTHSMEQEILDGKLNPGGAIGWNGKSGSESQIAGVDIPAAQSRESYTRIMPFGKLTTAFRRKVDSMVGSVNKTSFKGWEPGEVMFLGCSCSVNFKKKPSESDPISVTYNFAIQRNEGSFTLNGKTYNKKKEGFRYIWTISDTVVEDGKPPALKVKGVFLEKVCPYADLNELGLGK